MRRVVSWKQMALIAALGAGSVATVQWASLAAQPAADAETELKPLPIPDAEPEKLFEFLEELQSDEPDFASPEEERDHQQRMMLTGVAVADNILSREKLSDEEAEKAAQLKVQSYVNLAVLSAPAPKRALQAIAAIQEMAKDDRKVVSRFAANNLQVVKIICVFGLKPKDRDQLIEDVLAEVKERNYAPRVMRQAQMLGEALGESGDHERVLEYYEQLAKLMHASGIENLVEQARRLEGQVRRLKLPGNELELTGTTLAGEKFDWASYRGKVVLVDFWATWCGPCRQELPNIKKAYKKYHKQGFEVVGISLDEEPEKLEEFLQDQKIPWVTLFESKVEQRGWENPIAVRYGVSAIPLAILVNQEGKVVSLTARGPELDRLLESLLEEKK